MKELTIEEKQLLLKDLCARLPYGVICTDNRHGDSRVFYVDAEYKRVYYTDFDEGGLIENCKPYLRPMSSMTEEERDFANNEFFKNSDNFQIDDVGEMYTESQPFESIYTLSLKIQSKYLDWLTSHHFDYRGLIEKGLALEAPEGIYNIKEQ